MSPSAAAAAAGGVGVDVVEFVAARLVLDALAVEVHAVVVGEFEHAAECAEHPHSTVALVVVVAAVAVKASSAWANSHMVFGIVKVDVGPVGNVYTRLAVVDGYSVDCLEVATMSGVYANPYGQCR